MLRMARSTLLCFFSLFCLSACWPQIQEATYEKLKSLPAQYSDFQIPKDDPQSDLDKALEPAGGIQPDLHGYQ